MIRRTKLGIVALLALLLAGWLIYQRGWIASKQRGIALDNRVATLQRQALKQLKIGTDNADVIRFLSQNGFTFYDPMVMAENRKEQRGEINAWGTCWQCGPAGCWDSAVIEFSVIEDQFGTVQSKPTVVLAYTDCM